MIDSSAAGLYHVRVSDKRYFFAAAAVSICLFSAEQVLAMFGIESSELAPAFTGLAGFMLLVGLWLGFDLPLPTFPKRPNLVLPDGSYVPRNNRKVFLYALLFCALYAVLVASRWVEAIQVVGGVFLLLLFCGYVALGVVVVGRSLWYWLRRRRGDPYH